MAGTEFGKALLRYLTCSVPEASPVPQDPLWDWSLWQRYRTTITHPATTVRSSDVQRARENIDRYSWARAYRDAVEKRVQGQVSRIDDAFITRMIPTTTPGVPHFTPCPACRDQGKPVHPHGQWNWSAQDPDRLTCTICGTVFPNERYAETVTLKAEHGGGQTFTYYGGEPFTIFSYPTGRPSFTGSIRARKVDYMSGLCRNLAEAYTLTGKPEYAQATRKILLRFAEVYPNWLVHVGYGEYADMDPRVAAQSIEALPKDELCPPPTKPDRKLHTGFWSAGRATGSGQEGHFVRTLLEAYDLTCTAQVGGRSIYDESERLRIEKDLLLESTLLLIADKSVNNKSVGNATATALVGMALGHPELVRFGLDAFQKTVDGWFLSDGGTPESWSYALMTLNGIHTLGQAFRGYSDPPGYRDRAGKRLEDLDLYRLPAYRRVWEAMFLGLQGDLRYPPLADGYATSDLGARFAELMAANYPERAEYRALLRAIAGDDLSGGHAPYAIYYRKPGLEKQGTPPLLLPDHLFPVLQIGYLRDGVTGRDSLLLLSASDWGGHHHNDSLNLYLWQDGHELLSDLGYLWDHPLKRMTARTFAHNTVLMDDEEQITRGRGGKFILFAASSGLKVMEAESKAYPQARLYRRTVAQIETAPGRRYFIDIFRVQGGRQHDYIFHGPNNAYQIVGPSLKPWRLERSKSLDLANLRGSDESAPWRVTWKIDATTRFHALWPTAAGELSLLGDGWGQRDYRNTDIGALLPYIVRRLPSAAPPTVFVTAFEACPEGQESVRSLRQLPVPTAEAENTVALALETKRGVDYLISCGEARPIVLPTPTGSLTVNGRFTLVRTEGGRVLKTVRPD
jgi:hypothetical protein